MKSILIVYASRWGVTKHCAELLKSQLDQRYAVTLADVEQGSPDLHAYELVILGSNVRMGRINKGIKRLLREQGAYLSSIPSAFFLCLGYPKQFDEYVSMSVPKGVTFSLGAHCFGGELKPDKLRGMDKWIVRMVRSSIRSQDFEESDADHHQLPEILPENVTLLADKIKSLY